MDADERSLYFGEQHNVKLRQILRAMSKAGEKSLSMAGGAKLDLEMVQKELAAVATMMKMYKSWETKKGGASARAFIQSWSTLEVFIKSDPACAEDLYPILLTRAHIDVRVQHFFVSELTVEMIAHDALQLALKLADDKVQGEQFLYIRLGFMSILMDEQTEFDSVANQLADVCGWFAKIENQFPGAFPLAVRDQIFKLRTLAEPEKSAPSSLANALDSVRTAQPQNESSLLGLVKRFMHHGSPLLQLAKEHNEFLSTVGQLAEQFKAKACEMQAIDWKNAEVWVTALTAVVSFHKGFADADSATKEQLALQSISASTATESLQLLGGHVIGAWLQNLSDGPDFKNMKPHAVLDDLCVVCADVQVDMKLFESLTFAGRWFQNLPDILAVADSTDESKQFTCEKLVGMLAVVDPLAFNALYVVGPGLSEQQKQSILAKVTDVRGKVDALVAGAHSDHLVQLAAKVRRLTT